MTGQSVLVGAFERPRNAIEAVRALRVSGIPVRKMGLAQRSGEILETSGLLADADVPEHNVAGTLIGLGVPVRAALQYQAALERGCAIVTAQSTEWQLREATMSFAANRVSALHVVQALSG
jgi:hypothetical protein